MVNRDGEREMTYRKWHELQSICESETHENPTEPSKMEGSDVLLVTWPSRKACNIFRKLQLSPADKTSISSITILDAFMTSVIHTLGAETMNGNGLSSHTTIEDARNYQ